MSEYWIVATHAGEGDNKSLVLLGAYNSESAAKAAVESQAGMLLNGTHKSLSIYKVDEENRTGSFVKSDLKHVFQAMATNLNNQADSLKKQADAAYAAMED